MTDTPDDLTPAELRCGIALQLREIERLQAQVRVLRWTLQDVSMGIGQGGSAHEISQRTTPIIRATLKATK